MQSDAYTISEFILDVGDGYSLYVQDWGNKNAANTIIFLHGGPGGQCKDRHKTYFDPTKHRVVFFDQRGCGQSTPYDSLENNTTDKSIDDITAIADKLGFDSFSLFGTSWGSTLALAYAIANTSRVTNLIIGGVFTGSKKEANWLDQGLFRTFYPDVWQRYIDCTPEKYRDDPSAHHFDKVLNGSPEEQRASGYAYESLEGGVIKLDDRFTPDNYETYDPTGIRIEMYYLKNGCFLPDRYVFDNADKLTMPVHIVQGRYDMVCPPAAAYELHQRLPNSELYWTLTGHAVEHEGFTTFKAILNNL